MTTTAAAAASKKKTTTAYYHRIRISPSSSSLLLFVAVAVVATERFAAVSGFSLVVPSVTRRQHHNPRRSYYGSYRTATTAPPPPHYGNRIVLLRTTTSSFLRLFSDDDDGDRKSDAEIEEEARLKILEARRYQIRSVLKSAEGVRNLRTARGWVPEVDPETGKPTAEGGAKLAVAATAFCVAAGAVALRIGGRAALVSAVGLDFTADNPELKQNLESILDAADSMDGPSKLALFTACWTAVKVLCFDAGGVVLALASGVLFGGVIQGAVVSAAAATFGSSVAFAMAKLGTPVRAKALQVLEEYPSLRGIEKVVARDGFKAILTLRLAPILPIPIGLYNYIYGVTNVPFLDFATGIFCGSLKPYLLDSYLGYFGKSVVEGTADGSSFQDVLLLAALGFSVLIGVFASQLAGETWESVLEEVEAEKKAKKALAQAESDGGVELDDGLTREFLGLEVPDWVVAVQQSLKDAERIVNDMVVAEYNAKVWNYTKEEGGPPSDRDPAKFPDSPEVIGANKGIDIGESTSVGLVLSPLLFAAFTKFADPLFDESSDDRLHDNQRPVAVKSTTRPELNGDDDSEQLQKELQGLAEQVKRKIERIDEQLRENEAKPR